MLFNYQLQQLKEEAKDPLRAHTYRLVPESLGLLWVNRLGHVIKLKMEWEEAWHLVSGYSYGGGSNINTIGGEPVFFPVEDYHIEVARASKPSIYSEEGINLTDLMEAYGYEGATQLPIEKACKDSSTKDTLNIAPKSIDGVWIEDIQQFFHVEDMVIRAFISKTIHYVNGLSVGFHGERDWTYQDIDKIQIVSLPSVYVSLMSK